MALVNTISFHTGNDYSSHDTYLLMDVIQEAVREQTDLLRTSLIGHIFRLFASNNQKI